MNNNIAFCVLVSLLVVLCLSGCASNQPVIDRLGKIETMHRTERSESVAEFEALKQELATIRTRLDAVSKAQADLMVAMDQQNELIQNAVQKLEYPSNAGLVPVNSSSSGYSGMNTDNEMTQDEPDERPEVVYQTAYNDYINRNYDLAVLEFQGFLTAFPNSDLADNAQYWIGECYYSQQRYEDALAGFSTVLQQYPNGDKYIPAMLKKGLSQIETGNLRSGKMILAKLIEDYPYSTEAKIAQDRLANP